jgi:hypothetical protein
MFVTVRVGSLTCKKYMKSVSFKLAQGHLMVNARNDLIRKRYLLLPFKRKEVVSMKLNSPVICSWFVKECVRNKKLSNQFIFS